MHARKVKSLAYWLLSCWLCGQVSAQNLSNTQNQVTTSDSTATQRLLTFLDQFQNGPLARHGTVALSVRRVRDGESLIGYNSRQSLSSASTLKLITTATALATLGPNFTYATTLEYDGVIKDSVLTGNLYLRGSGDPSLGTWRYTGYPDANALLLIWSDAVRKAGIRRIDGVVIGDAALYDDLPTPDTWPWGDLGNYYGAGLSALNFNENLYRVIFRPGKTAGSPASVLRTEPALPYLTLNNRVTTDKAGTGDQVNIYGAPFAEQQWLTGKVPMGVSEFAVKGSLPDPAHYVAFALTEQLRRDSVRIVNPPVAVRPDQPWPDAVKTGRPEAKAVPKRILLHQYKSPVLLELAQQTNFQSINLYAEALLRTAARQIDPKTQSVGDAVDAVERFWRGKGANLDGFRIRDGSGLSTVGALTADNMTGILAAMGRERVFPQFYETIPVVGQTGTVRNMARNTPAAGNVRAKSGTIEGVRAYAGYFTAKNGELMSFSVMINKYTPGQSRAVGNQLERLMALLVDL
nr:D-alanyl-D-alanine carboxypeptidase/D-alanyl-D-alanine-endopeptidase [uncultured Arsenicibacter sp.]